MTWLEKSAFVANCLTLVIGGIGVAVSPVPMSAVFPYAILAGLATLALSSLYFQSKRRLRMASMVVNGIFTALAIAASAFLMLSTASPPGSQRVIFRLAVVLMALPWLLTALALFSTRKKALAAK
jgi:hypothetical protein